MRVLISSVGTRGDVQPAAALALQIRALGHDVRLCVPPNFTQWLEGMGFEAQAVGIEVRAPRAGAVSAAPGVIPDLIADQFEKVASAAQGCDLIVAGGMHQYAVRSIAELCDIPAVVAVYAPVSLPSADLAPPGQSEATDEPASIARLWDDARRSWNERALERVNANRARLGLAAVDDVLGHILAARAWLAADATLGPAPATPGMEIVQTGAWILPDPSPLSPELEAFLEADEAPVYLGFGSMPAPAGLSRSLIEAVRAVGRRAIVSRGWADLDLIDNALDCITIDEVNQQRLFPRMAAVVHHGGAGTTTTAALAGAAQVVTPMFSDQFYWGNRVRDLAIGSVAAFAGLSADRLASALSHALEPTVAARARAFATTITRDDAAFAAKRLLQEFS